MLVMLAPRCVRCVGAAVLVRGALASRRAARTAHQAAEAAAPDLHHPLSVDVAKGQARNALEALILALTRERQVGWRMITA